MPPTPSLSQEVGLRRKIAATALQIFAGWSYQEIDVPLLDHFDQLRSVLDPEDAHRTFRLIDRDGNLLVLRSDVTPAIARIYAHQLQGVPLPLRVCYANKIVRLQRAFTREQSENYQIGVELIGAPGLGAELEVALICLEVVRSLGVPGAQLNLGHVGIYRRLLHLATVPSSLRGALTAAVSQRDPHSVREVAARLGLREHLEGAFLTLARLAGGAHQLDALEALLPHDEPLHEACAHLRQAQATLAALGYGDLVQIDLGMVDGPPYYTGLNLRVLAGGVGRELGGGGRYDDLIGSFGAPTPAVGFALRLDALLAALHPSAAGALAELDAPAGAAVRIDPHKLVAGFEQALQRRREHQPTKLIFRSGGPPSAGWPRSPL